MKPCGECTLCCRLENIPPLGKRAGVMCQHCYTGCLIHPLKPQMCKDFQCEWTLDESMDEGLRPDKVGLYAAVVSEGVYKVAVGSPGAEQTAEGQRVIEHTRQKGHVVVLSGRTVTFIDGYDRPPPEKIVLDWVL